MIVCTTKPDKYDRYLADVFVAGSTSELKPSRSKTGPAADRSPPTAEGSTFLNNALLSSGHALPYVGGA